MRPLIRMALVTALSTAGSLAIRDRAGAGRPECAAPHLFEDSKYKPGQIWEYKTRPGESASRITILRVENADKVGVIVHVGIAGVRLKSCGDTVQHAPFAKAALDESVTRQSGTVTKMPAYEEGYNQWLANCGGVYTIKIAEVLNVIDSMLPAKTCD